MNTIDFYVLELIMGLVYDTASAQVIQVVKIGVSPDIIPKEIDLDSQINYPNYSRSILSGPQ